MSAQCRIARHRAMTLLEILLVLALIVIVFAVAVPTLTGSLSNQRLKKSGEVVRASFSHRVEAMRTGQIQAFHCQVSGNKYATVPWYMAEDAVDADESATADVTTAPGAGWGMINEQTAESMPDGIVFISGAEIVDERTETIAAEAADVSAGASRYDTPWSPPILFYPDGTTSDARVVLRNERGWMVAVELRGLTGVARVGRPEREPQRFRERR